MGLPGRLASLGIFLFLTAVSSKVYDPCEFAAELSKAKYNVSFWEIPKTVCIAYMSSGLDTAYSDGYTHGIFRINVNFCKTLCNADCRLFEDEDLQDDVRCNAKIKQYLGHEDEHHPPPTSSPMDTDCQEPWKQLRSHDCHEKWKFFLLGVRKLPKYSSEADDSDDNWTTVPYETAETSTPGSETQAESHTGSRWYDSTVVSDSGFLIIAMAIVLIAAIVIELWRRYELPLSHAFV